MPPTLQQQLPCTSYRYVLTPHGGEFIQIPDLESKDEESPADYNPGGYLPIQVGDTFKHGRYKVVRKLGWGHFSTVWLVKDKRLNCHSAIKVVKSATRYAETALDEIRLLSQISNTSPSHPGLKHIVTFLDSFSHSPSPTAQTPTYPLSLQQPGHICIVFEPLGENLLALILRHKQRGVPKALVKYIARQVLEGLQYLHDECDLVHTDIKPENILIQIPDIESHISSELSASPNPTARNVNVPLPGPVPNPVYSTSHSFLHKYPGAMTIPSRGSGRRDKDGTSRRVQIWDSQPLGSPIFSPSSGSSPVVAAFPFPVDGTEEKKDGCVQGVPQPEDHLPSPSTTLSPSSSSSSLGFGVGLKLGSSVVSTPNTSISLGLAGISKTASVHGLAKPNINYMGTVWELDGMFKGHAKPKNSELMREKLESAMGSDFPSSSSSSESMSSSMMSSFCLTPPECHSLRSHAILPPTNRPRRPSYPNLPTNRTSHHVKTPSASSLLKKLKLGLPAPAPVPAVVSLSNVNVSVFEGEDKELAGAGVLQPTPMSPGLASLGVVEMEMAKDLMPPSLSRRPQLSSLQPTTSPPQTVHEKKKWTRPRIQDDAPAPPPTPVDWEFLDVTGCCTGTTATPSRSPSSHTARTITPPLETPTPMSPLNLPPPIQVKIADLGNATPSSRHFTEDIQTRQYRSPEAIMGRRDWGCKVDIWSVACLIFELLTAEYLFDPQDQGTLFSKDDDHLAQIIELVGDFSCDLKVGGRYSRDLFEADGSLRYIKTLKPWPLKRVMMEKYGWDETEADELCEFMLPMLTVNWKTRLGAKDSILRGEKGWLGVRQDDWREAGVKI